MKLSGAAIGPGSCFCAVVCSINYDGIVCDTKIIELFQNGDYHGVMFDQAVWIETDTRDTLRGLLQMRPHMHAGCVKPNKEGLAAFDGLVYKFLFGIKDLHINCWHPLLGKVRKR